MSLTSFRKNNVAYNFYSLLQFGRSIFASSRTRANSIATRCSGLFKNIHSFFFSLSLFSFVFFLFNCSYAYSFHLLCFEGIGFSSMFRYDRTNHDEAHLCEKLTKNYAWNNENCKLLTRYDSTFEQQQQQQKRTSETWNANFEKNTL